MMEYDAENGEYFVDYDQFDVTEEVISLIDLRVLYWNWLNIFQVETPLCSASHLDAIRKLI